MTYITILEALDGRTVDWMERASDEEYRADPLPDKASKQTDKSRQIASDSRFGGSHFLLRHFKVADMA